MIFLHLWLILHFTKNLVLLVPWSTAPTRFKSSSISKSCKTKTISFLLQGRKKSNILYKVVVDMKIIYAQITKRKEMLDIYTILQTSNLVLVQFMFICAYKTQNKKLVLQQNGAGKDRNGHLVMLSQILV